MEMNTGIYVRVGTEDKLLEQMTEEERVEWINERFPITQVDGCEPLIRMINILCPVLNWYENLFGDKSE